MAIQLQSGRRVPWLIVPLSIAACFILGAGDKAIADVIVLANRTGNQLTLRFQTATGAVQQLTLPAGEVRPMFVDGRPQIEFNVAGQVKQYQLDVHSAYFFGRDAGGRVDMQKIGLGEAAPISGLRPPAGGGLTVTPPVVAVKILVDEEEPALQFAWETRLRRRVEAAAKILQRHSGVQLRVVGVGTWNSDNGTNDFVASLTEFEKEIEPFPARLAIGFTSQFQMVRGRVHMAGTRGPLSNHILVREGSPQINEPERLEFLVHELGHFLGAAHSPEKTSVMRPVLGDNQAGRAGFQIGFDPVNTLIIASIGEEMGRRNVQKFADLSADTKRRLQSIYASLARALPDDPAGGHFMRLTEATTTGPLVNNAKRVLQGVAYAAAMNQALLPEPSSTPGERSRLTGDALTEHLVRHAAGLADKLPDDVAASAFLLGVAIALDDAPTLEQFDESRSVAQLTESLPERTLRTRMLGEPTLGGRRDIARRFFAAAYLASALGADAAKELMLAFELGRSGGGCDFVLVAADRAGIAWGADVSRGRFSLELLTTAFSPRLVMPAIDGLPSVASAVEFTQQYRDRQDPRFRRQLFVIDERISNLPAYRRLSGAAVR